MTTQDNIQITGNYFPGSLPYGIILIHTMPETKESFTPLATMLASAGCHTLAVDLRGHGTSDGGDFHSFTDEEHQASIKDLEAAAEYLSKQNPNIKLGFIGASIGANLSIEYASRHETGFIILLSAGLNYKGINAEQLITRLPNSLPVWLIAAKDDLRSAGNSAEQNQKLFDICSSQNKQLKIFETGGHGTDIFKHQPGLQDDLVNWIRNHINDPDKSV